MEVSMDIIKVFGNNVRKYRNRIGFSQEKLAEICKLHRTYISDIERFKRKYFFRKCTKDCRCTQY